MKYPYGPPPDLVSLFIHPVSSTDRVFLPYSLGLESDATSQNSNDMDNKVMPLGAGLPSDGPPGAGPSKNHNPNRVSSRGIWLRANGSPNVPSCILKRGKNRGAGRVKCFNLFRLWRCATVNTTMKINMRTRSRETPTSVGRGL